MDKRMDNRIAVVGMEAWFGDGRGIDSFDRYLYNGENAFRPLVDTRRQSFGVDTPAELAWLQGHDTDCMVLVRDLTRSIALQLNLASQEVELVVYAPDLGPDEQVELQGQVASLIRVHSLSDGLRQVQTLVENSQKVVALVAVGLLGSQDLPRALAAGAVHTLIFDEQMQRYGAGEGAAALLCKSAVAATAQGDRIYGFVEAMASASVPLQACKDALQQAGISAADIGYLEATASDQTTLSEGERRALLQFYRNGGDMSCALGSARAVTGECGAFSELAGLVKTLLCVYHRYIPGVFHWNAPKNMEEWVNSRFYFPAESRPWYLEPHQQKRYGVYSLVEAGVYHHIVVAENSEDRVRTSGYLAEMAMHCFPVAGQDEGDLRRQLEKIRGQIDQYDCVNSAAQACYLDYQTRENAPYAVVVLGESREELAKELDLMLAGLSEAFVNKGEWKTPKGSYFTAAPVGGESGQAQVAFVYPGVGAAYVGLGQDLFHMFPEAFTATDKMSRNIGAMLKDRVINPRSLSKLTFKETKALDLELRRSLATISECGVGFAYVFTKIFQNIFGVHPEFALGYSMGEVSMYTAMDCWQDPGALSARLAASPTFNYGLTGEMRTLRKHWDLPPAQEGDTTKLWETYTLKGTPEEVMAACEDEDRVYVTIVNTPDSIVLGGDPEACERVIKKLGVRGMAMEIPSAIHSEPAFKEYENMEKLYTLEVAERIETKLYSSSCYLPVPQKSKAIANSIAKCFCEQVDFPRLVNSVYDKGARVFMEMGAGRSCCSWIDKILKHEGDNKPHVSIPVNAKGTADHLTISRCLAKLVSHRVKVNLAPLYEGSMLSKAGK